MQRADVAQAVRELGAGASVLLVSERTGLHPFVVVRRVKELGVTIAGMDWRPVKLSRSEKQRAATTRFLEEAKKAAGKDG